LGLRLRRRRRSPRTGETTITPKKPTPEYAARKAALASEQVRLSLDLVEEGIVVDPYHRNRRLEVDGIVYDRTEEGIMVAYAVADGEALLLTFRDLIDP
jgi:hypothetical protein